MNNKVVPHPSAPAAAPRDWLTEAQLILMNLTMVLPERGHLAAVQDEVNRLALLVALQNRALIALMLSVKQTAFTVEPTHVKSIEAQGLDLQVGRPGSDAPIQVRLLRPGKQD